MPAKSKYTAGCEGTGLKAVITDEADAEAGGLALIQVVDVATVEPATGSAHPQGRGQTQVAHLRANDERMRVIASVFRRVCTFWREKGYM